jgi:hypothetical protein
MKIDYALPDTLTQADVKARLVAFGEYLTNRHGIGVKWNGDVAKVKGKYLLVTIEGTLSFSPGRIVFDGKDPGFLWRGKAKDYVAKKLKIYLDPSTRLDELPRR